MLNLTAGQTLRNLQALMQGSMATVSQITTCLELRAFKTKDREDMQDKYKRTVDALERLKHTGRVVESTINIMELQEAARKENGYNPEPKPTAPQNATTPDDLTLFLLGLTDENKRKLLTMLIEDLGGKNSVVILTNK
jgi:hypothetical protein